jgi:hypothetical protein
MVPREQSQAGHVILSTGLPQKPRIEEYKVEGDPLIGLVPGFDKIPEGFTKFRWNMHVPLPYPFPSRVCVCRPIAVAEKPFLFSIHNHFDRVTRVLQDPGTGATYPAVSLEDKRAAQTLKPGEAGSREMLQSVAWFQGMTDYSTPVEAFSGAQETIKACLAYLSTFLSACQREAPYLVSWLVYPITMFDIGTVCHEVTGFYEPCQHWHHVASAFQIDIGRRLQGPTFFMEPPQALETISPIDTANELLAEALMSLYRGVPRMTVLISYSAVELLANVVYGRARAAQLTADGVPLAYAEHIEELERKREDAAFLFHAGIEKASGRSFLREQKQQYDALCEVKKLRNKVAHSGYKPTLDEARAAHKLCCEAVRWYADVGKLPVKPLLPDATASSPQIAVSFLCGGHQFVAAGPPEVAASVSTSASGPECFEATTVQTPAQLMPDAEAVATSAEASVGCSPSIMTQSEPASENRIENTGVDTAPPAAHDADVYPEA